MLFTKNISLGLKTIYVLIEASIALVLQKHDLNDRVQVVLGKIKENYDTEFNQGVLYLLKRSAS